MIPVDLRGCGESDVCSDPAYYAPEAHLNDVHTIVDACGAATFALVGGATVARHLVAHSDRITRCVLMSTYFGQYFTEALLAAQMEHYADHPILSARIPGLRAWPGVELADLRAPTLVITGTKDDDYNVVTMLQAQRPALNAAGVGLEVFGDLDHGGLIEAVAVVLPRVQAFLAEL